MSWAAISGCSSELGKVPRKGVYDGEPAISVRRGRRLIYTHDYLRLRGTLGMGSIVLARGHPERKGVVERANGYFRDQPHAGAGLCRSRRPQHRSWATGSSTRPTSGSIPGCGAGPRNASTRTSR